MKRLLRLGASAALLAAVLALVDRDRVVDALRQLPPSLLLLAVVLAALQISLAAARWSYTAARLGVPLRFAPAFVECYAASFINQTLPGGVLGDVARAWRHACAVDARGAAIRAVVFERVMGQLALLLATLLAWFAQPQLLTWPLLQVLLLIAAVLLGLALWARRRRHRSGWLGDSLRDLRRAWWPLRVLLLQLLLSWLLIAALLPVYVLAARVAGVQAPLPLLLPLLLSSLLAMAIPLGFAGWGWREGAAALAWTAAGLDPAQGVATSILYGLLALIGSLPGALALLRMRHGTAVG